MNEVYKLRHAAKSASFEVFRKGMVMIMENVLKTIAHPVLTSYIEGKIDGNDRQILLDNQQKK